MIDKDKINIDWINQVSKQNRKVDKILVEKVIRALQLLEGLVFNEIPFAFIRRNSTYASSEFFKKIID